jgi:hypothetical protein
MPDWSEDEQRFARELQTNVGAKAEGLKRELRLPAGEAVQKW